MYTPVLTFFRIYAFNKNMHKNIWYIIKNFVRGCHKMVSTFCDSCDTLLARTALRANVAVTKKGLGVTVDNRNYF